MSDFETLYKTYAQDVFRFTLGLVRSRNLAEEIVAETFARALTAYDPARSLSVKSFLFTIARRLVIDHARLSARSDELTDIHADAHSDIAKSAEERDELDAIRKFLEQVPEIDRTTLLMRAHGLSYSEIAQALDISQGSAKVKVHRLRLKLAEWRVAREGES